MLSFIQRHSREIFLFLFAMLGIALGYLASTILGGFLLPSATGQGSRSVERVAPRPKPKLADFEIILQRNIFDSSAPPIAVSLKNVAETPTSQAAAATETKSAPRVDLVLLGTVSAESGALALIGDGKTHDIYRVGGEVPGGGKVKEITRNQVTIENSDGSESLLTLYEDESAQSRRPAAATSAPPSSAAPTVTGEGQIRSVGENRWIVDRQVAEDARTNIGELLKSARMEPNVVDGKTAGFVVKMIQPRSLLANLGIRRGDIIMEVNGVELSSPEKALQIFQQLREARNISIALLRGDSPMNFEFEIE